MPNSLFEQADEVRIVPCTITATSPLTVTILGAAGVLGVPLKSTTYTTGAANALVSRGGQLPIILQIGP
jgi:hypothetical protein